MAPLVEIVVFADLVDVGLERVGADEGGPLVAAHRDDAAAARDLAQSATDRHDGGVAFRSDFDSIISGALQVERQVGRVDFENLPLAEIAQLDRYRSFGELNLDDVIGEIEKRESGV